MLRKFLSLILTVLLLFGSITAVSAKSNADKETQQAAKVKENISKLGVGEKAFVKIRLHDNRKLEGHVSTISDESFTIIDDKTGTETSVTYAQVKQIKGNNLSTGTKIAIGVGITALLAAILVVIGVNDDIEFPNR
ncbi:MAG: hypothetical protein AB1489_38220 [Acidobacteriota bacterium]